MDEDENLTCEYLTESFSVMLSNGALFFLIFYKSEFDIFSFVLNLDFVYKVVYIFILICFLLVQLQVISGQPGSTCIPQ